MKGKNRGKRANKSSKIRYKTRCAAFKNWREQRGKLGKGKGREGVPGRRSPEKKRKKSTLNNLQVTYSVERGGKSYKKNY